MSNVTLYFDAPENHVLLLEANNPKGKTVNGGHSFKCPEDRVKAVMASDSRVVHGNGPHKGENDVVSDPEVGLSMDDVIAAEAQEAKEDVEGAQEAHGDTKTSSESSSARSGKDA
jgi:dynactin complex subunit